MTVAAAEEADSDYSVAAVGGIEVAVYSSSGESQKLCSPDLSC